MSYELQLLLFADSRVGGVLVSQRRTDYTGNRTKSKENEIVRDEAI